VNKDLQDYFDLITYTKCVVKNIIIMSEFLKSQLDIFKVPLRKQIHFLFSYEELCLPDAEASSHANN